MKTHTKTATVLAIAASLAAGASATAAAASNAPRGPTGRTAAATREPARAFLTVDARRPDGAGHPFYVGETIPVTIRAYFLGGTGVTLNASPRLASDELTLSGLPDKPAQTTAAIHGLPYTVVSWSGQLTATRAGVASPDVELPVAITYREAVRTPSSAGVADPSAADADDDNTGDDPFTAFLRGSPLASDPFFSQLFKGGDPFAGMLRDLGGAVRQREVTLRGSAGALRVTDLPAPAPAGFTGAVGAFDATASLAPGPYRVGEPTTLTVRVQGRGSFGRLSLAGIAAGPALATYGVTARFTPGTSPLEGVKTFRETIVPRRSGDIAVPEVSFPYFDPRERRYVTRRTQPIEIAVAPAIGEVSAQPMMASASPAAAATDAPTSGPSATSTNDVPDVVRTTLEPFTRSRRFGVFLASLAAMTVLLTGLGLTLRRGALRRALGARRLRARIAAEEDLARDAAARGDVAALFTAGRKALQERLASGWHLPPEAISAADVESRLGDRGDRIRDIFERADRVEYAVDRAACVDTGDLEQWRDRISTELRALESGT